MTTDISKIETNKVKNFTTGESVELKSLWSDKSAVVIFFRRWGCMFCRVWAKEVSEIAPILTRNNIKLIGVGVEEVGGKEFIEGKFFDGDLYYVESLATYQNLGFKRFNVFSIMGSLLWKSSRATYSKGKEMAVGGDLRGDWGQTGGALLVEKGGKLLHEFRQDGPGDHMSNLDILKIFGLEHEFKPKEPTTLDWLSSLNAAEAAIILVTQYIRQYRTLEHLKKQDCSVMIACLVGHLEWVFLNFFIFTSGLNKPQIRNSQGRIVDAFKRY
ncbi:hypothetical protein EVAR_22413_1 [Eumeta japonica]|uniref:Prostamide/prostaglandin F synthase n=1 Tax=Eumeta variegata TaxID=151549 RepID=A0A4C2A3P7_EUMVA|nr:hypothetical protein EVAR_22413_1 [Eumeta japonica]